MTRFRSRRWTVVGATLAAFIAVLGGVAAFASGDQGGGGGGKRPLVITAEVARRTLKDSVTLKGTVGRVEQREVDAATAGRVSAVHVDDGASVDAGTAILALDGRDAVAENGEFPFYRDLDVGAKGADVKQLEQILHAAGFNPGPVDGDYTEATRGALAQWQAANHYPAGAPERAKTVTISLGQGHGYTIGDEAAGAVVIGSKSKPSGAKSRSTKDVFTDANAPHIAVQAVNAVVAEGAPAQFRITADRDHDAVDLDLTVDGTASGDDVLLPITPVSFSRNSRSMTVDVPTRQDDVVEGDETITLAIEPETGFNIDATPASTTIVSDDVPELTISGGGGVGEGNRSVLSIVADQAPLHDIQVPVNVTGDAIAGKDYERVDPFVVLAAGQRRVDVPIVTLADDTLEDVERVVVSIAPSTTGSYTLGRDATSVVTIDRATGAAALPTITLRSTSTRVAEGAPIPLTLSLSRAIADDLTLEVAYSGDAVSGADYAPIPGRIVVTAGMTSIDLKVPTVQDDVVERDHTLTVSLVKTSLFTLGAPSSGTTIIESDDVPELQLVGGVHDLSEGDGSAFTIVADQAPVRDISVSYQAQGSATPGTDYEALTGVAILPAGATSVSVPLRAIRDDISFKSTDMIVGHWPIRVGQVLVDDGQSVTPGMPLLSLTDAGLTVTLHAGATDRTKLEPGQKVTVKLLDSPDEVDGTISSLDETASVDPQTKEQFYEGKIDVGDLPAADGATVNIEVVLDQRDDAITVPIAAVKQDGGGHDTVRVLDLDHGGKVIETKITTGISEGSYVEVKSGLKGGEVVIVQVDEPTK